MTATNYTYNAANQLTSGGATYDNNGNLTSDGVNSYTWDRANRLLSMGGVDYQYDGEGHRVQQTVSSTVTKYLLDIQPGLAVVLSQTEGSEVTRFVHAPRGIHVRQDKDNLWHWTVQDGLGTVRMETDNSVGVEGAQNLDPFGNLIDLNGTIDTPYGFTGELVDGSGLLDLRARRYNTGLGVFASLDPMETSNRYAYVSGNPINRLDPSGLSDSVLVDDPEVPTILTAGGDVPAVFPVPVEGLELKNAEMLVPNSNGLNLNPNFNAPPGTVLYTAPTSSMGRVNPIAQSALMQYDHVAQFQSLPDRSNLVIGYNYNTIDIAKGFVARVGDINSFHQLSDTALLYQDPYHLGQLTGTMPDTQTSPATTGIVTDTCTTNNPDKQKYIFRETDRIRPQAVALRRNKDYQTGLSFNENMPSSLFLKYRESDLTLAGFEVRHDGGTPIVALPGKSLSGLDIRPGQTFGPGHVTVYMRESLWDAWYQAEAIAKDQGQVSEQTMMLFMIRVS